MKTDKQRMAQSRGQLRAFRKKLRLKQEELAALAHVSPETVAKFERGKHVSQDTSQRICIAVFKAIAQRNPEAIKRTAQPVLEIVEKCDRVLSAEPGSEAALEIERLSGKPLAQLKTEVENMGPFFRGVAKSVLSLIE